MMNACEKNSNNDLPKFDVETKKNQQNFMVMNSGLEFQNGIESQINIIMNLYSGPKHNTFGCWVKNDHFALEGFFRPYSNLLCQPMGVLMCMQSPADLYSFLTKFNFSTFDLAINKLLLNEC